MIAELSFDPAPEELVRRHCGTIEVALLWSRRTDRAAVAVCDGATGERFELLIRPGDDALDVYEHPYAYAARVGKAAVAA